MKVFNKYLECMSPKFEGTQKLKAIVYLSAYYFSHLCRVECKNILDKKIKIFDHLLYGLDSKSNIYTFTELILDDGYNLQKLSGKKFVVLDLGANIGLFLQGLIFHGVIPSFYIGVEPVEENFRLLELNSKEITHTNFPNAVAKEDGKSLKFKFEHSSSMQSTEGDFNVKTISLQRCIDLALSSSKERSLPVLIKMDIEGGEWDIIDILINNLIEYKEIEFLLCELHSVEHAQIDDVIKKLQFLFDMSVLTNYNGYTTTLFLSRKA